MQWKKIFKGWLFGADISECYEKSQQPTQAFLDQKSFQNSPGVSSENNHESPTYTNRRVFCLLDASIIVRPKKKKVLEIFVLTPIYLIDTYTGAVIDMDVKSQFQNIVTCFTTYMWIH